MGKTRQSNRIGIRSAQRGISVIGALVVISVVAMIAMFGMSAVPMYLNHMTVLEIANDVAAEEDLQNKPIRLVKNSISQRFRTNSLWDLDPEEVIKVHREQGRGLVLEVNYEVRRPLFYNMELVARFSEDKIGLN